MATLGSKLSQPSEARVAQGVTGLASLRCRLARWEDIAFVLTLSALGGSGNAQSPCIQEDAVLEMGLNPGRVLTADLNGDGYDDILTLDFPSPGTTGLSVCASLGTPMAYGPSVSYPSPAEAYTYAVADVDGTPGIDVIVPAYAQPFVLIYRNLGGGTLDSPYYVPTSAYLVYAMLIADMNADGILDIVLAGQSPSGALHILPGQGAGAFGPESIFPLPVVPTALVGADFDNDGLVDIALLDSLGGVRAMRNVGGMQFVTSYEYGAGGSYGELRIGNLNQDAWVDLVALGPPGVSVLLNDGLGAFVQPLDFGGGLDGTLLVVRDFDGSNGDDVAVKSSSDGRLVLLLNNGTGLLAAGRRGVPLPWTYGASANLDGNTHPDLVSISYGSYGSPGSAILVSDPGVGQQGAQTILPAGDRPSAIASGYLNADSQLDLVVTNFEANTVSVLLSLTTGLYASPVPYAVGNTPTAVVVGDLDGDGFADIAVANRSSNTVSVLRNVGNGTFLPQTTAAVGFSPVGIAIGDLDGIAPLDLAVVNAGSSLVGVSILMSRVGGGFASTLSYQSGQYPSCIAIGDINQDGLADVVSGTLTDGLYSHTRQAGGGFATNNAFSLPPPAPIRAIEIAELDTSSPGQEIVVAVDTSLILARQNAPGSFGSTLAASFGGGLLRDIAIGSFTSATARDIVAIAYSSTASATLVLWKGGPSGPTDTSIIGTGPAPKGLVVGKFHGGSDTLVDLAVASDSSDAVWIQKGQSSGTLGETVVNFTGNPTGGMFLADMDLDQRVDVGVFSGMRFRLLSNTGRPALNGQYIGDASPFPPEVLRAVDVDGDGKPDLAYANSGASPFFRILRNVGIPGSPAFVDWSPVAPGVGIRDFVIQDLDGDADLDIILATGSATISGYPALSPGVFGSVVVSSVPSPLYHVVAGDVDGDTYLDLVALHSNYSATLVHGSAGLQFNTPVALSFGPGSIVWRGQAMADLNGDGRSDLVTTLAQPNAVDLRLSAGGALGSPIMLPLPGDPIGGAVLRDFDQDGLVDILVGTNSAKHAVVYFRNAGSGTFSAPVSYASTALGWQVDVGDMDADGDLDIVLLAGSNQTIKILWNCAGSGFTLCEGDGLGTACPCANSSPVAARAGCLNSLGLAGTLRGQGHATIGSNEFTLIGNGMPNLSALYAQGTIAAGSGLGSAFGDGLRCAAGTVLRLGTKLNAGNGSRYPEVGDLPVYVKGQVASPGTRYYHCWYRNAANFCTVSTFNLTNGLEVIWSY